MSKHVRSGVPKLAHQPRLLRQGLAILESARLPERPGLSLPEQPLDRHLLALSPLYRRSRETYLEGGGEFRPALVSSPRTLGSPILLEPLIEYSPIEGELFWAARDSERSGDPSHLLALRTYASSLFHEQSHRILWRELPPPPTDAAGLRRYLNFVESLVVTLDMALGDELGPALASVFYLGGVVYDPGTHAREGLSRRDYRNYLQASLHATYLNLELYDPEMIPDGIAALYPMLPADLLERATARALRLDRGFVTRTNPVWQKRHKDAVSRSLGKLPGSRWSLPADPMDNREQYLFGEKWLELFGL
jgi:hypothetical protein